MASNGIDFCEVVNLVNDPEPRVSNAGRNRATFRAAYNPRERDRQTGDYKDGETTWISVTAFGEYGDHVLQTLRKGDRALVKGRLGTRRYQDNNGVDRETLDLVVDAIGPDLRWATAEVTRKGGQSARQGGSDASGAPQAGGWSSDGGNGAQNADFGGGFNEPF